MRSILCLVVLAALLAVFVRDALAEGDAALMPKAEEQQQQPQDLLAEGDVDVDVRGDRVRRQVGGFAVGLGAFGGRQGRGRFDPYRGGPYCGPVYGGPPGRRYAGSFPGGFYGR
ncbi:GL23976 [Drosophila persimilis]|uniref:GL23976 n=1 Tax=Drosophila persimilis TaxID=7234 RepID=B4G2V4_DROPE|nr:GL23976 [Drosophila persimilis]